MRLTNQLVNRESASRYLKALDAAVVHDLYGSQSLSAETFFAIAYKLTTQ